MKKVIYSFFVLALLNSPSIVYGQFGNLKNKMKEKVEKLDKPSDKGSSDKKQEEEHTSKPAPAEEKTPPPPPAEKKESAPAKAPETEYYPNGDIKLVFGQGDNEAEVATISASPAQQSIFFFPAVLNGHSLQDIQKR